ncbi:MAG: ABC transporter ATP-binding protein [Acidimicrobiia bacterium]|nr:ABC transporter ATP-binding protein [Acidimicrobiia bacterium]
MSVTTDGLSVSYGADSVAVHELSLRVETGEWLGLLGPNGAGKSTMLKALAGLVKHTGAIYLSDIEAATMRGPERARLVAFVPQEPVMPSGMSVAEYVLLGRTPHLPFLGSEGKGDLEVAATALDLLNLTNFSQRPVGTLSGGERRRVVLGRAIAQEADILLLDEPTSALDIGQSQSALELICYLRKEREMTVITAMHDLTLVGQFADRLLLMSGGRSVADGPPEKVLTADFIRDLYQADVEVVAANGGLAVLPTRRDQR